MAQSQYAEVYASWQKNPEEFWAKAAEQVDWFSPPEKIFDSSAGRYGRWFVGGTTNTCYNAIDRHVAAGRGDSIALIYDSPLSKTRSTYCYTELLERIATFAAVLQNKGVKKGDRVIIYMPMIPEAVVAMLACARIGAIHSVVFGGFAAHELATRIDDASPVMIIAASCGIEPNRLVEYKPLLDAAIDEAKNKPDTVILFQRPEAVASLQTGRDFDWMTLENEARTQGELAECVPLAATDPLYVLYTSGTTGTPKGVVRDNGGHMVALQWSMKNIYGAQAGDVYWAASDVGWVVGHSYIVYGPLLAGCATVLYEGKPVGTPDAGAFWRMIEQYQINVLFTAPTAFRAIKKEDPQGQLIGKYNLKSLRALFLAGERADPDTIKWAEEKLKVPVIDHWWQTETGWAICANPLGLGLLPVKHGSPTVPMPGYTIDILDDRHAKLPAGQMGSICIKLPLPPGCLPTLWNNDARFEAGYTMDFPGYYKTADAGYKDEEGYLYIMARTDDIINVAGHRLSTGGMEEVVASHPSVAECAVIGIKDDLKGQVPAGFVVLKAGVTQDFSQIEKEVAALVRDRVGPVAAYKKTFLVNRLPKTRSGKILRGTMQKIADDMPYTTPATIDDPAILDEIRTVIKSKEGGHTG